MLHGSGGTPISPVLVSNHVVLAFGNGTLTVHNVDTGVRTDIKSIGTEIKNTPCVSGNSVFVVTSIATRRVDISTSGIILDTDTMGWSHPHLEGGGASPLFLNGFIYHDARVDVGWKIFRLASGNGAVDKSIALPGQLVASIAQSPVDNTMFYYTVGSRIEHVDESLNNLGDISLATLGGAPSSAMTMASNNVMIVGTGTFFKCRCNRNKPE